MAICYNPVTKKAIISKWLDEHLPEDISKGELARRLNRSNSQMTNIFKGRTRVYADDVLDICIICGLDIYDLQEYYEEEMKKAMENNTYVESKCGLPSNAKIKK